MIEELNTAISEYWTKWQAVVAARTDKAFFEALKPTAVAYKTTDLADFDKRYEELRARADQIHFGWVNERWLATFHLREKALSGGIHIVKLMQRRPASTDAVGLDHLDLWFDPGKADAKAILSAEPNLKWSEEKNGDKCKWLSIWFEGAEAKVRSDTVVDVCIEELQDVRRAVLD